MATFMTSVCKNQVFCGCGHIIKTTLIRKTVKHSSMGLNAWYYNNVRLIDTDTKVSSTESNASQKGQKISQAMKAYLERAKSYEKMMTEEIAEYEIGKRHLANIMDIEEDSFTQADIDKAIRYLLPSGLHDKKARPQMKHPTEAFPPGKSAMFSADGRPFHSLFYTGQPNYYQIMFEAGLKLDRLKALQDGTSNIKDEDQTQKKVFLAGSKWIEIQTLKNLTQERISENDYTRLITILDRIAQQPNSSIEEDFIFKFRKVLTTRSLLENVKGKQVDTSGRTFQTGEGKRKTARAEVTVYRRGTGQFTVNGKYLLDHFPRMIDREQLMFPLQFTGLLGEVDVIAKVEEGGCSSQAGAIRLALSRALQTFVDTDKLDKMRLVGLLTPDPRVRERKKFGQEGARKKFTWKKR